MLRYAMRNRFLSSRSIIQRSLHYWLLPPFEAALRHPNKEKWEGKGRRNGEDRERWVLRLRWTIPHDIQLWRITIQKKYIQCFTTKIIINQEITKIDNFNCICIKKKILLILKNGGFFVHELGRRIVEKREGRGV